MKCKSLHKSLIFFLDGELPEAGMEKCRAHLLECEACRNFAEDLKKTLGIIEAEKCPEVSSYFYTRVKARLQGPETESKAVFWRPSLVRVLQPAAFSLLLLAGIYTGFKIGSPGSSRMAAGSLYEEEVIPYLNEMESEPIETFLME